MYLYFSTGNGQPREPVLCQLYRHTFVPYQNENVLLGYQLQQTSELVKSFRTVHMR